MENKYNTAIRIDKLDAFEADVLTKKISEVNAKVINKGGKFLQFKDNEYQLVQMTSKIVVSFKTFIQIHFGK